MIRDDPAQALSYVRVQIGGQPCRALLDTGSARSAATPTADAAVEEVRDDEGASAFGLSGQHRVWRTSVGIGDHKLGQVVIDAYDERDGQTLLGQDVLSCFRCEYRLTDRLLRLDGPKPPRTTGIFVDDVHHVYFDVIWPWHAVSASAVFDTGASVTIVDAAFVEAHQALTTPAGVSRGTDGSGVTQETPMVILAQPEIFGRSFTETIAAVVDLSAANRTIQQPVDLILGWPILRQANWFIDHPQRQAGLAD